MKKIGIVAKFIASLIITTIGLCPGIVALADTKNQDNNLEERVQIQDKESSVEDDVIGIRKVSETTSSAVKVEKPTSETNDAVIHETVSIDFNNEYNKANEALGVFKATNNTKKEDIIDLMKSCLDSNLVISVKYFNNTPATVDTFGTVTGILTFKLNGETQEVNIYKTIDKLKVQNVSVSSLEVKINKLEQNNQLLYIGDKAFVEVCGFDTEGKQVELKKDLIQYQWFVDGKAVLNGTKSELKITREMKGKDIECKVSYDEGRNK